MKKIIVFFCLLISMQCYSQKIEIICNDGSCHFSGERSRLLDTITILSFKGVGAAQLKNLLQQSSLISEEDTISLFVCAESIGMKSENEDQFLANFIEKGMNINPSVVNNEKSIIILSTNGKAADLLSITSSSENPDTENMATRQNQNDCGCNTHKLKDKDRIIKNTLKRCNNFCVLPELVYDFRCKGFWYLRNGSYEPLDKLQRLHIKYGKRTQVTVINVNRYMYDIDMDVNDSIYSSEPPAMINDFLFGSGDLIADLTTKYKGQIKDQKAGTKKPKSSVDIFFAALEKYKKTYDKLVDAQIEAYTTCDTFPCCSKVRIIKYSTIANQLSDLKHKYYDAIGFLMNDSTKADSVDKEIKALQKKNEDCDKLAKQLEILNKDPKKNKKAITELVAKIKADCKDIDKTPQLILETKQAKPEDMEYKKAKLVELRNFWMKFSDPSENDLKKLLIFYNNLTGENQMYVSPPIYPQGDRLSLNLQIKGRDSSPASDLGIPLYSDQITLDVPVRWKPFLSFSSGTFYGFSLKGKTSVQAQSYDWQPIPDAATGRISDSSSYRLVATGYTLPPIGPCAFATGGAKFSGTFGIGLSAGVGLTVEDKPRLTYLGGVSLLAGDKRQFNFTFGAAAIQMNVLKTNLYTNGIFDKPKDLEYNKELKTGWFVSLSYTVFNTSGRKNSASKSGTAPAKPAASTTTAPAAATVNVTNVSNGNETDMPKADTEKK